MENIKERIIKIINERPKDLSQALVENGIKHAVHNDTGEILIPLEPVSFFKVSKFYVIGDDDDLERKFKVDSNQEPKIEDFVNIREDELSWR